MELVLESIRVSLVSRLQSVLVALIAMAVPAAVLAVAGLGIEAQVAILGRLDDVGAKVIVVTSSGGTPSILPEAVGRIANLRGVAWVVGLGPVVDLRLRSGGGQPTPMRLFVGVHSPVRFSPNTGEGSAFVSVNSAARLGIRGAYGVADPGPIEVKGWFTASEPLEGLQPFVLVPRKTSGAPLDRVILAVQDAGQVPVIAANLAALLGRQAAAATTIDQSPALGEARAAILDEFARQNRTMVVAALIGTVVVCAVVVFMGTLTGRRDFGRRRALGASRAQLTALVVLATVWPALVGSIIGVGLGWAYTAAELGRLPDPRFALSIGWLAFVATVGSSALPALIAATRDPLRVLRVP